MIAFVVLPGMDGTRGLFAEFVLASNDNVTSIIVSYPKEQVMGYQELVE